MSHRRIQRRHYRLVDLRHYRGRQRTRPWWGLAAWWLAAGGCLAAGFLFVVHAPFPGSERVRPAALILANAQTPAQKGFCAGLADRLRESGRFASIDFARLDADGSLQTLTEGAASVGAEPRVEPSRLATAAIRLGQRATRPILLATINRDDTPNRVDPANPATAQADLLREGVLCLDLAEPPETRTRVELEELTPGLLQSTVLRFEITRPPSQTELPDFEVDLDVDPRDYKPDDVSASLVGTEGDRRPVAVTNSVNGTIRVHVSGLVPRPVDGRLASVSLEIMGVDIANLRGVRASLTRDALPLPPPMVQRPGSPDVPEPKVPRVLYVPLAAFVKDPPDPAWIRQIRGLIGDEAETGSYPLIRAEPQSRRLGLGRGSRRPVVACDFLLPVPLQNRPEWPSRKANFVNQFVARPSASSRYHQVILDLSWPTGLTEAARDEYFSALRNDNLKKLVADLAAWVRAEKVHVLVLGVTPLVDPQPKAPAHLLDPLVELVKPGLSTGSLFAEEPAPDRLALLIDQTESASNAADLPSARLRTLPPYSVETIRDPVPTATPPASSPPPGTSQAPPPLVDQSANYLDWLGIRESIRSARDELVDESAVGRLTSEADSKTALFRSVAAQVEGWTTHPLLQPENQGRPLYPPRDAAGKVLDQEHAPNTLRRIDKDTTLEAVELEEMFRYLRSLAIRNQPTVNQGRVVGLCLFDADDCDFDEFWSVRVKGEAQRVPIPPLPAGLGTPRDIVGSALGVRVDAKGEARLTFGSIADLLPQDNQTPSVIYDFGRAFLYAGRSRVAALVSAKLADALRGRRVRATRDRLDGLDPAGASSSLDPWLSDDFLVHASANLRTASLPAVRVDAGKTSPWQVVVRAPELGGRDRAVLVAGPTASGGLVSLLTLDRSLEADVFAHSSEGQPSAFEDWVQPHNQVETDSGTKVIHVRAIGSSPDMIHLEARSHELDMTRFPPVPKPGDGQPVDQIDVALAWLGASGEPLFASNGRPLTARQKPRFQKGSLAIPTRPVEGDVRASFLRCTWTTADTSFDTVIPLAGRDVDSQISLRVAANLDTSVVIYSELILDALARREQTAADPRPTTRASSPALASSPPTPEPVPGFATAPADGIALGPGPDRLVMPSRLEIPLVGDDPPDPPSRPAEAAAWIESRAGEVFEAPSHRGWLVVSLLLAGVASLIRATGMR